MLKEALQFLMSNAVAITDNIKNTSTPLAALPSNIEIESLEKYMPGRSRLRGKYEVNSLAHFIAYTNTAAENEEGFTTQCFVNIDNMSAKAFFNIGDENTPGHCDRTALLTLKKTADYNALLNTAGTPLSQKDAAEWLEDWRKNITVVDTNQEEVSIVKAIAAIRNITIEAKASSDSSVGDFNSSKSAMETIEAQTRYVQPAFFIFKCTPYNDLDERDFVLRLSIITGRDPILKLRLIQHEKAEEAMGNELLDKLNESLDVVTIKTYIGSYTP